VFRDELGLLAESFNGMADKLARTDRRRRETLVAHERMEERLRESEEQWRSLTENSTDYIMTVDLDDRIQFINRTLPGLSKEQVIGTSFHRYAEPEYEPVSRRCFTEVANSARPGRFESAYREADGSLRFFESRVAPVMRSGQVAALTVSSSDITERRRAEEALRESEERFRQAFEHAAFGMALLGTDGRFLQVNQSVCRMFGFSEEELKKKTFQELTYPDDLQIGVELFGDLLSGRRDHGWLEKRYVRKDGRVIWTLLSTTVVRDAHGATLYLVSQIQDITDRKQAEADVVERKEQYQGIFEATSDGFVITDLEGTIIEVNPAFLKMHDSSRQELLGRHSSVFVHPDDQGQFGEFLEAVRSGKAFQGRWMDVRRDGATFHAEVRGTPFAYRGERHALGVVRDISEEVRAQQVLEERVAARTRELAVLYDVTAVASASLDLRTVMDESLERVLEVMGCEIGGIHLRVDQKRELRIAASRNTPEELLTEVETMAPGIGVVGHVLTEGVPIVVPVVADDPRVVPLAREVLGRRPYVGTPMRAKGEILGVLSVIGEPERQFTAEEVALLASIADQIGVAVENARLYEQAEQLAVMEERQRLARELHDSVTQSLYSANLMAETGRRAARAGLLPAVEGYLERLGQIARDALKEMRLLVYELRPSVLESEGLIAALQQRLDAVEGRAAVEARLLVDGDIDLPGSVEVALYRIAQEALNNALKHADASVVTIRIRANAEGLELEISDDGCGFEPSSPAAGGGMGLTTMRERSENLGGQLSVISKPGDGTTVKVRLDPSAIS
jgi:PAS domain S-box-containing protein